MQRPPLTASTIATLRSGSRAARQSIMTAMCRPGAVAFAFSLLQRGNQRLRNRMHRTVYFGLDDGAIRQGDAERRQAQSALTHSAAAFSVINPGEMWEEWCHFEQLLVSRRNEWNGLSLGQFHPIVPCIHLHSPAKWQRRDLVEFIDIKRRRRITQYRHTRDCAFVGNVIAKMRCQQRRKVRSPCLQCLEK